MEVGETCNLGDEGVRARRGLAVVAALAAGYQVWAVHVGILPPFLYWTLWPTVWAACLGAFQARQRTCVVYAFRGVQQGQGGVERVAAQFRADLQNLGARILLQSVGAATAVTVVLLLLFRP